ncbi:MAG: UTP--glucose-1-phosphate uridylyltransferase GalU [bacterium]|nr:UTP--glucose-1-phosphate uridylyltransferase GalU [bacterium]
MKIKKAVIPAAGLGTRVLPISKTIPKEMIPIVDKPAIQYIVEEAVAAGITDILIITNRGKGSIEDHFDHCVELESNLEKKGKFETLKQLNDIVGLANIQYVRQKETGGLGHAVLCAKSFVGDEPFAVLYGDDVILGDDPVIGQLCRAYEEFGRSAVGIKQVSDEDVQKYSSMKTAHIKHNYYFIDDMIEKPKKEQIFSNYSILGRCVLNPNIFKVLETIPKGVGDELQLTDAMKVIANTEGITGVDFIGKRYDIGNKFGIMQANIDVGLRHPEISEDLKAYIKQIAKQL